MSARISKTQASRNKLQGLIREAEILKAQHLAALKAVQTDAEYQALEDQVARQTKVINQLRVDLVQAQDGRIDTNKLFAQRSQQQIAQREAAIQERNRLDIEVQNLREKVRLRDGKLFDYRIVSAFLLAGTIVLGVTRFLGV